MNKYEEISETPHTNIVSKIYIGCHVNHYINLNLNNSDTWKHAKNFPIPDNFELTVIRYNEKDYIGMFLPNNKTPLKELRKWESHVRNKLSDYCPDINTGVVKIKIFPQLFLC